MKGLLNKFKEMSMKGKIATIIGILFIIGIFGSSGEEESTTETSTVKQEETVKEDKYTTQYLTDQGKQAIKNSKEYDYKVITEWTPLMSDYIDNKVKVSGTVEKLHLDNTMTKFLLNVKDNNTPFPVEVKIPSSNIDVEFKEGDTITVNGRFEGSITDEYNGEKFSYWTISAYYLEKGDTTKDTKEKANKEAKGYDKKEDEITSKEDTGNKTTNKTRNDNMEVKNTSTKNKSVDEKNEDKSVEKKEEKHTCWRCGANATKYHETWLCEGCYYEKLGDMNEPDYDEEGIEYYEEEQTVEEEIHCKFCGRQINNTYNGEYACESCYKEYWK